MAVGLRSTAATRASSSTSEQRSKMELQPTEGGDENRQKHSCSQQQLGTMDRMEPTRTWEEDD